MGLKSMDFDLEGCDEKIQCRLPRRANSGSSACGKIPSFTRRWNPTLTSKSATLGWAPGFQGIPDFGASLHHQGSYFPEPRVDGDGSCPSLRYLAAAPTKRSYSSGFPEVACSSSAAAEAGDRSRTRRYAASIERQRAWQNHRGWYRVLRVQKLLREFRSLFFRIPELRRRQSDHRDFLIDPWNRAAADPSAPQHEIDCGKRDRRNLCRRRPHMWPVDSASFAVARVWGGCWTSRSKGN